MSQTDPTTLGDLWRMIERDSNETREYVREQVKLSREEVRREIDDVKRRLDGFVTRDHFESEKRLLEARVAHVEAALEELERQETSRSQSRREFVYKGIIPVLALIIAAVSIVASR